MLQQLHIHNYAIIESIEVSFTAHLNIITGETGAGKSILMGALSLILGERADTSVLLHKDRKCVIEGRFKTNHPAVKEFLKYNELDEEQDMLIRREISANGKSRAFINDTPVTLSQLRQLSTLLVDLHQQFDTLELNSNDFQREVLDALASNGKLLEKYQLVFKKYRVVLQELEKLKSEQLSASKELDYNRFLFDELEDAGFNEDEIEELDAELKVMSHAENTKSILSEIYAQLEESEQPLVPQLKMMHQKLQGLQELYPEIGKLNERLNSLQIELQDIASDLDGINSKVHYDEGKMSEMNERMTLGYSLMKKHHVQTTRELTQVKENLSNELQKVTDLTESIAQREKSVQQYGSEAKDLAQTISAKRLAAIPDFEHKVDQLLSQVGMPNARIKVEVTESETLNGFGNNWIEFLFNANLSSGHKQYEPLRKVASGGELSRLMLSIKSLVAKSVSLPTLIFDEIDSGISGEAARQVGIILKDLSTSHQVISITHQPQIAARADTHFFVFKETRKGEITTGIKILDPEERILAIATMLSGKKPTAAAFENAREMIGG